MKKWLVVLLIVTVGAGALFAGSPRDPRGRGHQPMMWIEEEYLQEQLSRGTPSTA